MKNLLLFIGLLFFNSSFSQSVFISEVVSSEQGLDIDGNTIGEELSYVSSVIGSTDAYYSLGIGGSMVLKFSNAIKNIEGVDFIIYENSIISCRNNPEKVDVFGSQNGCDWGYLGKICQGGEGDMGDFDWIQYIKIVDISTTNNGYDISGIEGFEVELNPVIIPLINNSAQHVVLFEQGTNGDYNNVALSRSHPENALGTPQETDVVNFVSLGFGGKIILKFNFIVFNKDGDDLCIVETTYGNPECNEYPEQALVEVSLDCEHWVELGVICLDACIDLDTVPYFQYIKLSDKSPLTQFNLSADGYDVDGVLSLNTCGEPETRLFDNTTTVDEESEIVLSPNPFDDTININNGKSNIVRIYDYHGKLIKDAIMISNSIKVSDLPKGVYYIEVDNVRYKMIK